MRRRESRGLFVINIFSFRFKRPTRTQFCSDGTAVPLLGRAERSTPGARRVAPPLARGVDGESACQATMARAITQTNVTAFYVAVDPLSALKCRLRLVN